MIPRMKQVAFFSLFLTPALATSGLAHTRYEVRDLGVGVIPAAINKSGEVVGTIISTGSGPEAFLYRGGAVTRLGQLGGTGSWGLAINDLAEVVGTTCQDDQCHENSSWGQQHAFLLKNGQVTDLTATAGIVRAKKINSSGLVLAMMEGKVILYDEAVGNITDISEGILFTRSFIPVGLNDQGDAVFVGTNCPSLECTTSYLFSGGSSHALPEGRFFPWFPTDINNQGLVVGFAESSTLYRGIIYSDDATMISDDRYLRFTPQAINDQGLMVGAASDLRSTDLSLISRCDILCHGRRLSSSLRRNNHDYQRVAQAVF